VVNIVRLFEAVVDQDHALDQLDQIELRDRPVLARNDVIDPQALVELVAPHALQIVTTLVEQLAFQVFARIFERGRIARSHALVELEQRCLGDALPVAQVPLRLHADRAVDILVVRVVVNLVVERQQFLVHALFDGRMRVEAIAHRRQGAQQNRHRDRALAIELDRQVIALARLELHPRTAIGDQLGRREPAARGAIFFRVEVHAGRPDQLAHHHALGAVDDERPLLGHQREIAHEDVRDDDLIAGGAVDQRDLHVERGRKGDIPFKAGFFGVFGLFEPVSQAKLGCFGAAAGEVEPEVAVEAFDRANLVEQLAQTFRAKPFKRIQLDFNE